MNQVYTLICIFVLTSYSLGDSVYDSTDRFYERISEAYEKGDRNRMEEIIDQKLYDDPDDVGALAFQIYFYVLFKSNYAKLSKSISELETVVKRNRPDMEDRLIEYLDAPLKLKAKGDLEHETIGAFPIKDVRGWDPVYLFFISNPQEFTRYYLDPNYREPNDASITNQAKEHSRTSAFTDKVSDAKSVEESSPPVVLKDVEVVEEVVATELATEEPSEVVAAEPAEEPAEESSSWWLWLTGLLLVVGGVLVARRQK